MKSVYLPIYYILRLGGERSYININIKESITRIKEIILDNILLYIFNKLS